jgi:hypothetical protein
LKGKEIVVSPDQSMVKKKIPKRLANFYGIGRESVDPNNNMSTFRSGKLFNDYSNVKSTIGYFKDARKK